MSDDADTIWARIGQESADAIEAKLSQWFGNETELGAYDLEAVRELGKNAI